MTSAPSSRRIFARNLALLACATALITAPAPSLAGQDAAAALPAPLAPLSPVRGSTIEFLRCMAARGATMASGHRAGPAPGYPENAVETAAHTLSLTPMLIEVDVRTTRDGVMVLMHDDTLERTTTGTGTVGEHSWADLQALNLEDNGGAVTPFRIPTLAAMLGAVRGRGVLAIDVKEDASIPAIARAIHGADARGYAFVNLYRPSQAMVLHAIDPQITLMMPVESRDDLEVLRRIGVNLDVMAAWMGVESYNPRNPELWAELRRRGMPLTFATLYWGDRKIKEANDPSLFNELADQGVDIIASDMHILAYQTLNARRDTPQAIAQCAG